MADAEMSRDDRISMEHEADGQSQERHHEENRQSQDRRHEEYMAETREMDKRFEAKFARQHEESQAVQERIAVALERIADVLAGAAESG